MEPYITVLAVFGALVLLTAWLPMLLKEAPLSLPIIAVAIGVALFAFARVPGNSLHPQLHLPIVERLTEFVVIISLMGAGLKIDRALRWRQWALTWRLLGISMPLTIAALAVLAMTLLGVGLATAVLLAAVLAPTDPVLASDIQVGPPGSGNEDEVRFALTSEAGLNDGLAFPFVHAAILLTVVAQQQESAVWQWLSIYVLWKMTARVAIGAAVGWLLGWLLFRIPNRARLSRTGDGLVAIGITCIAYAVTEMAYGYGFLAVFVAALAIRAAERNHRYHERLHDFAEQLERLLMVVLLVLVGGALWDGSLLVGLSWSSVAFGLLALFVVRPLSGWVGLIGTRCPWPERGVICFYGIRGLGSFYYLAFALQKGAFEAPDLLWSTMSLIVLLSIMLHGATVTPVMRYLDRRQRRGAE
jgi:NhaP-type Na+/H+ or K+/H+ antiporter